MAGPMIGGWGPPLKGTAARAGAADRNYALAGDERGANRSSGLLGPQPQRGITLLEWRPFHRNTLFGFAAVRVEAVGLTISDIAVHQKNESRWVSLPSKPMLDRDGAIVRDPATSKIRYSPILQWRDRATAERFSHAVIEALLAAHPDTFEAAL
jgi:hypothetical protein